MALTDKQALFVAAYLADPSTKRAAIVAGYSEETAAQAGSRLLKHPKVLAEIERRKSKMGETPPAEHFAALNLTMPATRDGSRDLVDGLDLTTAAESGRKPLDYMLEVMNDPCADEVRRDKMAVAAAPYMHIKKGEGGKKDEKQDAAKKAAVGRFAPAAPPKLIVNNAK